MLLFQSNMTQGYHVRTCGSNYIITQLQPVNYGDENVQVEYLHVLLLISKLNVSHCTQHSV